MLTRAQIEEYIALVSSKMMCLKNEGDTEEKYPVSLIDIDCWEWPQGVGLYGLFGYYKQSGSAEVLQFLTNWFDTNIAKGGIEKNINTTAPMLTLAHLYEIDPKPEYGKMMEEWCAWIMSDKGLIRTGDGAFQHMITGDPNDGEILIDTLFMTLLFLTKAGRLLGRQDYLDQANYQVVCHITYLYEKQKRLFFHGWNFNEWHNYGKVFWGRGNSWYTVGILELLSFQEKIDPALRKHFEEVYRHQVEALLELQDPATGLWHTVLDDADSYIEVSASCAFLCGILKGVKLGILDKEKVMPCVEKGVQGAISFIGEDGAVGNVSYGTPIGHDKEFYKNIPICPMTYGQALMILLLQELL